MNNIKSLIAALTFAGLTACADNSPKTFSGFITDASMNTVTVRALTDESTCTFATTDADKSDANGLLLGAPVTVDYTGKLKDGTAATKIATDPTYAEAGLHLVGTSRRGGQNPAQGPEPRQRPDHRLHPDGHDRQNGRRELHPHDRGHGHGLHQGQAVNSFSAPKSQRLRTSGGAFVSGRVRRPFFPENSGSDAC